MTYSAKLWFDRPNQKISLQAKDLNRIEQGIVDAVEDITDLTPVVCITQVGGTGSENGANTWAKLLTVSTGSAVFADAQLILGVAAANSGTHDTAIISALFRARDTGQNPGVSVEIIAKGGTSDQTPLISADSFKMVSGGFGTDMELWIKKTLNFGRFAVHELARCVNEEVAGSLEITYSTSPAWQSATPTGTANNATSSGVTAFGIPVVTTTGTQTITGKTLTSPTLVTPALGTPASGTLTNCTFPTLNQNTTGTAAGLSATLAVGSGGTGATTLTGLVKGNSTSAMTAAVAGTDFVAPGGALGTPSSGTLTNCTFPTLNQNTTGSAAKLTTARTIDGVSFDGSAAILTTTARLLAPVAYTSGQYYFCNSVANPGASATLGNGTVRLTAWLVTQQFTLSSMFCEFTAQGDSTSVFRIGIWSDDGTGKPGTVFLDAGTVSTFGTPAVMEITGLSTVVTPGLYWVGGAVQGVTSTQPTMRVTNTNFTPFPGPLGASLPAVGTSAIGLAATGQTGAFSTISSPTVVGSAARIGFKVT